MVDDSVQTVFVVDDDESFLRSARRFLEHSGYTVECFSSARDFLSRHLPGSRGCVLSDLQMPEMDGLGLLQALNASSNPLPVVFLTGHGDIPSCVVAVRGGAEDFLVKTSPGSAMLSAIERALDRERLEHQARAFQDRLNARFMRLTTREREALSGVLKGYRNKQIALAMGIDERSVKRHRSSIMTKLEVGSVVELTALVDQYEGKEDFGAAPAGAGKPSSF